MLHQDLNGAVCEVRGGIVISPKIAPWKRTRVDELVEILGSDGVIGIVDIDGVPGKNMLDMRASLRSKLTITMAKKTLIRRAWESSGKDSETLEQLFFGLHLTCDTASYFHLQSPLLSLSSPQHPSSIALWCILDNSCSVKHCYKI